MGAPVRARSRWLNVGMKLVRNQPVAGLVERLFLAPMSHSRFLAEQKEGEEESQSNGLSRSVSSLSLGVSWSDSHRERTEPGEDVMEDCKESHQSEINRRIKAKDKLWNILTFLPEEHRATMYGDSLQSKMESLDDEKAALLAAKRQRLPLQCQVGEQKIYLERLTKDIGKQQQTRLEVFQIWIGADQELEAANGQPNSSQKGDGSFGGRASS